MIEYYSFGEVFRYCKKSGVKAGEGSKVGRYPFFTSSDILSKRIDKYNYEKPSLIFGTGGSASIHFCEEYFSTSTDCLVTQPIDYNNIYPKFVYYFFRSNFSLLEQGFKGAGLKHISKDYISKLKIPLPPLPEQKRIADLLDKADSIRQKRKESIALMDEFMKSVFIDMFGDPVRNEKGWEEKKLKDVCIKINDGTHFSPPITKIGIPYITAKHVKINKLDFWSKPWFISKESHMDIYKRCSPEQGDVLYIKDGATTGIAAINKYDFEFSMLSSLALLKVNKKILTSEYLCSWLNNEDVKRWNLEKMAGVAIKRLTLTKIEKLPIHIPPKDLQTQFAKIVEQTELTKSKMEESLREMDNQFGVLLQGAFRDGK
ncbi:MAG TPA: restriction endonuclease subunit S [Ignavibacteria bacterium]|nr:restriction endonuclease subunit S [Ignavibacteria bacterium]HMR41469.1 restriction endonuclease subunit S [Ignavibacteria bacterium]